jgi:hypothetical protein
MSPVGIRSEKGYAGDARQRLKSTDPTSRQRGRLTSTNPKLPKKKMENGKHLSQVPDGCLITRRTGRQTAGRNITLTLTLNDQKACDTDGKDLRPYQKLIN